MKGIIYLLILSSLLTMGAITDYQAPISNSIVEYIYVPLPDYVSASEKILEGKIVKRLPSYFISSNMKEVPSMGAYLTDFEIEVTKYYKDEEKKYAKKIVITQEGTRRNVIYGTQPLQVGQRGIFLLTREEKPSQVSGKLMIFPYGFYKIQYGKIFPVFGEFNEVPVRKDFRHRLTFLSKKVKYRGGKWIKDVWNKEIMKVQKEYDKNVIKKQSSL